MTSTAARAYRDAARAARAYADIAAPSAAAEVAQEQIELPHHEPRRRRRPTAETIPCPTPTDAEILAEIDARNLSEIGGES